MYTFSPLWRRGSWTQEFHIFLSSWSVTLGAIKPIQRHFLSPRKFRNLLLRNWWCFNPRTSVSRITGRDLFLGLLEKSCYIFLCVLNLKTALLWFLLVWGIEPEPFEPQAPVSELNRYMPSAPPCVFFSASVMVFTQPSIISQWPSTSYSCQTVQTPSLL